LACGKAFPKRKEMTMWKKNCGFISFLLVLILMIIPLTGCGEKPPTQEISNAEKSVSEALQKEANIYAPDIFSKAEESLKMAKDLLAQKKYKEAKKAAEDAVALSQQAISQVEPNKSKMKAEIDQMVLDVEKGIGELKGVLAKLPKQLGPRERKELQELIRKWEQDLGNIKTMVQAQKMRQAYDQLKTLNTEVSSKKERLIASAEEKKGIK
jgi:predicted small lipoprotein YifL